MKKFICGPLLWLRSSVLLALSVGLVACGAVPQSSRVSSTPVEFVDATRAQSIAEQREQGLSAEYFPTLNFSGSSVRQIDALPLFLRGQSNVSRKLSGSDLSIVWEGFIQAKYNETYTFFLKSDGQAKLTIGKTLVVATGQRQGEYRFEQGKWYKLRLEYSSSTPSTQRLSLAWRSPSQREQVVPQSSLRPNDPPSRNTISSQSLPLNERLLYNGSFDQTSSQPDGWGFYFYDVVDHFMDFSRSHTLVQDPTYGNTASFAPPFTRQVMVATNGGYGYVYVTVPVVDYQMLPVDYTAPGAKYSLRARGKASGGAACKVAVYTVLEPTYPEDGITLKPLNLPTLNFGNAAWTDQQIEFVLPTQITYTPEEQVAGAPASGPLPNFAIGMAPQGTSGGCQYHNLDLRAVENAPLADVPEADIGPAGGYLKLGQSLFVVPPDSVKTTARLSLEALPTPPVSLPAPLQNVGAYRVSGSAVPFDTNPATLVMAVTPLSSSEQPQDFITELYGWDGSTLEQLQIGDGNSAFSVPLGGLFANQGKTGFAAGYTLIAGRAGVAALTNACTAKGGSFNGRYCELPEPAQPTVPPGQEETPPLSGLSAQSSGLNAQSEAADALEKLRLPGIVGYRVVQPASQGSDRASSGPSADTALRSLAGPPAQARAFSVLSFQAGNAVGAGSLSAGFGRAFFCFPYQVKLCNYSDEGRVRAFISRYKPDLIAIQETWNNLCSFTEKDQSNLLEAIPISGPVLAALIDDPVFKYYNIYSGRVCNSRRPNTDQMGRIIGRTNYDYRCAKPVKDSSGKWIGGYECVAVRKGVFEFATPLGTAPTGALPFQVSRVIDDPCSKGDTGFQLEKVRPVVKYGSLDSTFLVANAHLFSPAPFDSGTCQANQIAALNAAQNGEFKSVKSLVMGDFNSRPQGGSIQTIGFEANANVMRRVIAGYNVAQGRAFVGGNLSVDVNAPFDPEKTWYYLSEPAENTATVGINYPRNASLDHVITNFAVPSPNLSSASVGCVRADTGYGFDHLSTLCRLSGFDGGDAGFVFVETLLNYPPPNTPNPVPNPFYATNVRDAATRHSVILNYLRDFEVIFTNSAGQEIPGQVVYFPSRGKMKLDFFNTRCPSNSDQFRIPNAIFPESTDGKLVGIYRIDFSVERGNNNWCLP